MSQSISQLSQSVQDEISAVSLDLFHQQHLPISIYTNEMKQKAAIAEEHAQLYSERLKFDISPLTEKINAVTTALIEQKKIWKKEEMSRDASTLFWYSNKDSLYKTNAELSQRLYFQFKTLGQKDAVAMINEITLSDDDMDAIDAGCRFARIIKEYMDVIAGKVYSREELEAFVGFYSLIEDSQVVAQADKTAPHDDRILRDKIYLYLRSLEEQLYTAADAAFIHEPKERQRYFSAYGHHKKRRQR